MSPSVPDPVHVPMCDVIGVGRVHLRKLLSPLLNHCSVESLCGDFYFLRFLMRDVHDRGSMDSRKWKRRHASSY